MAPNDVPQPFQTSVAKAMIWAALIDEGKSVPRKEITVAPSRL
jgi:hypothetical protein